MHRHPACDRGHRVLPDAEMDIPAAVAPLPAARPFRAGGGIVRLLEITHPLEPGKSGGVQVGRAAHQPAELAAIIGAVATKASAARAAGASR